MYLFFEKVTFRVYLYVRLMLESVLKPHCGSLSISLTLLKCSRNHEAELVCHIRWDQGGDL